MTPEEIRTAPVRYIKLGTGGAFARAALERGEIYLDHREVPHELAMRADRDAIIAHYISLGRPPGKAKDFSREVMDFHTLPEETIWITFGGGCLWWARAKLPVEWIGPSEGRGTRLRQVLEPWRNTDLNGAILLKDNLSTRLTKVAGYRQTLCAIEAEGYLRQRLIGEQDPMVADALEARAAMLRIITALIAGLHETDFETLVDVLLARGGWHRVSTLGGTMKDADLLVEHPVSGERVLVQVKSRASQRVLDDYIERFDANPGLARLIFACHSPTGKLQAPGRPEVAIWSGEALADASLRSGLLDWLIARAG